MDYNYQPSFGFKKLEETKLNRIITHHMDNGFVILSAHRSCQAEKGSECSEEEIKQQHLKNIENDTQLKKDIVKSGFSYIPVFGGFKERVENPSTHIITVKEVYEPSYIIPANRSKQTTKFNIDIEGLYNTALQLIRKYNQDSFLFYSPEKKTASFINQKNEKEQEFNNFVVNDASQVYFTKLGGSKQRADRRFSMAEDFNIYGLTSPQSLSESWTRYGELFLNYNK